MPRRFANEFLKDSTAAFAASYALALTGIIAAIGIGYDYAQVAALDTEIQNAADQAALAAATQLDGSSGSIANATSAASSLVTNKTLMAGDAAPAGTLTVKAVTFYPTKADAEADSNPTTTPANAHFVKVELNARNAKYALTPVVGLFRSPDLGAAATAGLSSTLCKVPPMFICNPNADPASFPISSMIGKGLLLTTDENGGNSTSTMPAGNFGFLDVNLDTSGSSNQTLAKVLGYTTPPGDCVSIDNPSTKPGQTSNVISAFNTRFDIFEQGDPINCYSDGLCPPSDNSRKDLVQVYTGANAPTPPLDKQDCGLSPGSSGKNWAESARPYRPTSAALMTITKASDAPDAMGYPRDLDQALPSGSLPRVGNGTWDVNAYWWSNYGAAYTSQVTTAKTPATPTRYEVYKWERANKIPSGTTTSNPVVRTITGGNPKYASYLTPVCKSGLSPAASTVDRRVLSVAVVNCSSLTKSGGKIELTPIVWADVFLVEPSANRSSTVTTGTGKDKVTTTYSYTSKGDIYVEVVGASQQGIGSSGTQFTRRDKPYLIK